MHEEHPQGPFRDIPVEDARPESDLEETPKSNWDAAYNVTDLQSSKVPRSLKIRGRLRTEGEKKKHDN